MSRYSYAIDLGSNTLRGVVLDCKKDRFIYTHESIVRTAEDLHRSGKVSNEALKKIVSALMRAKEFIDTLPKEQLTIKAVTTEAIRVASNANEILSEIEDKTSIKFEVIDGFLEAKYTMSAVRYRLGRLNLKNDRVVTIDIGGGSTEISIYDKGSFIAKSFKLGILTLSQSCSNSNLLEELDRKSLQIEEFIKEHREKIDNSIFTVTAGTPTTLIALKLGMDYDSYNSDRVNGQILSIEDIDTIYNQLKLMNYQKLSQAVGKGREELIPVGIAILKKIYNLIQKERAIVIDDGLREGVAISLCQK